MRLKTITLAGLTLALMLGMPFAARAEGTNLFNNSDSGNSQPIFMQKYLPAPSNASPTTTTTQPYSLSPKTSGDYAAYLADLARRNEQADRAQIAAAAAANQRASEKVAAESAIRTQQVAYEKEQKRLAKAQAAKGGAPVQQQTTTTAKPVTVFTKKKKTDTDTPVRLFNVR